MSMEPELALPPKEKWGTKLGVVLAVAGSAVGLGNFLRFPGQAVNNGGGAFMIPYIISFVVLGIPVAWCEWTMGRLGGRFGQNSGPGIMYALWRRGPAKIIGAMTLLIPVGIYMYYILLEAWCLDYCVEFVQGGFAKLFADAARDATDHAGEVAAIVGATGEHYVSNCGLDKHGAMLEGGRIVWLVLTCFLVNFFIIYQGVTRGIEKFCKWAMPALIICALIILARVLTLPGISTGLGFMWNPQWEKLSDPQVWLAASGQIFFSLSVGLGLILCYSSYLRSDDDVVLTSLSASSTNEFCEVILGGMIVVPTAFLFLGAENAKQGTFGLGFVTVPAIMNFMPGGPFWGSFFGGMWFGLLFLAAVTSSLSMLQPAIAFLEDGFGLRRRSSVTILAVVTACGTLPIIYFSRNALALDTTDFWCNLTIIISATCQVLVFGWIIGARKGLKEMNRGADFQVPGFVAFMIRFITPAFLIVILAMWSYDKLPDYLAAMNPTKQGAAAARGVYVGAIEEHFGAKGVDGEEIARQVTTVLGPEEQTVDAAALPEWLRESEAKAEAEREKAAADAKIARFVFLGLVVFFILLVALADIACRNRIGTMIRQAEGDGLTGWEAP
ncbi:MAG: sodium-dependent transporter [Planctomycetes bacterium]|nr:sodium-dependent transporter [Planctomycetota bacterium]